MEGSALNANDLQQEVNQDWSYLLSDLKRRTCQPFRSVPFVFYALLTIIVFGGAGVWIKTVKIWIDAGSVFLSMALLQNEGTVAAASTFCLALLGSASHQLILSSTGKADKVIASFAIFACVIAFLIVVAVRGLYEFKVISYFLPIVFTIVPMWLWWIANSDDPLFAPITPDAATGGNPDRALKGNLEGYEED